MPLERLDHVSIRTTDVQRSVAFYAAALGMVAGPRPPFNFPGAWLYRANDSGQPEGGAAVHIIGLDANRPQGLLDYLGDKALSQPGGGAFDHAAFSASDIEGFRRRLDAAGIPYREREVPVMGLRQLFVDDPDGITIELNFPAT